MVYEHIKELNKVAEQHPQLQDDIWVCIEDLKMFTIEPDNQDLYFEIMNSTARISDMVVQPQNLGNWFHPELVNQIPKIVGCLQGIKDWVYSFVPAEFVGSEDAFGYE